MSFLNVDMSETEQFSSAPQFPHLLGKENYKVVRHQTYLQA
jgi:hypothetical protein